MDAVCCLFEHWIPKMCWSLYDNATPDCFPPMDIKLVVLFETVNLSSVFMNIWKDKASTTSCHDQHYFAAFHFCCERFASIISNSLLPISIQRTHSALSLYQRCFLYSYFKKKIQLASWLPGKVPEIRRFSIDESFFSSFVCLCFDFLLVRLKIVSKSSYSTWPC